MANTLRGIGAHWGVGSLVFSGVVISASIGKFQSASFSREGKMAQLLTEDGETIAESYYDESHSLSITIIPTGATISAAKTNEATCLPSPGTIITLATDPHSTITLGTNGGKYLVQSSRSSRTNTGFLAIDIEMKQWVDNDVAVAVT